MARYKHLPTEVDAIKIDVHDVDEAIRRPFWEVGAMYRTHGRSLALWTLEGWMGVADGAHVIKGTRGEFWVVQPDIFEASYELVE